jgi:hypothetical protein
MRLLELKSQPYGPLASATIPLDGLTILQGLPTFSDSYCDLLRCAHRSPSFAELGWEL